MSDQSKLDKVFHVILKRMMDTGQAPHYTEIASELGVSPDEGLTALKELYSPDFPGWLYPNTYHICSFPPFNNVPTQYRITIDGEQKWFGQWGFESLAVCWLFPGKVIQIDAPCLDCGEPIRVEMKDGAVQDTEPESLIAYTSTPLREWFSDLPYAWSDMNLFRSEEHVRNYSGFKAGTEEGMIPLPNMVQVFSGSLFTRRLDPDYVSNMQGYMKELIETLHQAGSFWQMS